MGLSSMRTLFGRRHFDSYLAKTDHKPSPPHVLQKYLTKLKFHETQLSKLTSGLHQRFE